MDRLKAIPLKPLRIAVLLGGDSEEREISLQSGRAVARALAERGHTVAKIDPSRTDLNAAGWSRVDIAFLALHGPFGEDGRVQQILEDCGVPYTGSDSTASELAFHKSAAKQRFREAGVSTPPAVPFSESDSINDLQDKATDLGFPVVVKPDAQGSSIGVTIVRRVAELKEAVERCRHVSDTGLIEKAILGTEWTLGVVDTTALPLLQITTPRGFFDYAAKYEDDGTGYLFETDFDESTRARIEAAGLDACRALNTSGIARVDIMLDDFGQPWVLEVNTIPGMTDHSLVPKAAERAGLSLGELCETSIARLLIKEQQKLREAS